MHFHDVSCISHAFYIVSYVLINVCVVFKFSNEFKSFSLYVMHFHVLSCVLYVILSISYISMCFCGISLDFDTCSIKPCICNIYLSRRALSPGRSPSLAFARCRSLSLAVARSRGARRRSPSLAVARCRSLSLAVARANVCMCCVGFDWNLTQHNSFDTCCYTFMHFYVIWLNGMCFENVSCYLYRFHMI